jgi:nucleotide-binding universal stress UspA family protein
MTSTAKPYVIVVGIDYSESGKLALERALEVAIEKPAAEVHVINVMPVMASDLTPTLLPTWAGASPPVKEAAEELQSYVERRVIDFRARHLDAALGCLDTIRAHQRVNVPSEEVAQLAADVEADLVVVGSHGRRGLSRLVLGSVAETTVRLAPCPVLVVRPKATPAPVPFIEPPCARCVETRRATGGAEFWCEQHREHHGQRHTYHQGDRVGAETNLPLVVGES